MPSDLRPARTPPDTRARDRARILVSLLVLQTLAFTAAPGRILPDTKLDMALNPSGFLSRALHMWDPAVSLGQVQNQAYGYFFPMGPFYLLGDLLHVPPWITQRLWLGLVLCTAFLGVVKLAKALGMGSPSTRLLAGFAYALAPRAQVLLGTNSSEFWPTAVLPWMLLPLVTVRSPRRAAALSALAVVACGGINATAELAVLVVPLLYLLWHRGRLLGWWFPLVAAASFWWLAPTYLMGRHIFEFLPYTETAATTTSITSPVNVLRGTSQWTAFLPTWFNPWWPAGNVLAYSTWLILATALVAGLGLLGIRRSPHRPFLATTLLLGLAVIVTGHSGTFLADHFRDLLDGPLAAFRNLHKFDALLRLPLSLGLACLLPVAARYRVYGWKAPGWFSASRRKALDLAGERRTAAGLRAVERARRFGAARTLAVVMVGLTAVPAVTPGLGIPNAPKGVPRYMQDATGWLDERLGQRDGAVLSLPGQQFGQYVYGQMMDDPLQSLFQGRWAGRMVTPGGSAGLARLMEAVDERFADGLGSPGLAAVLSRMGVRYLLIRNDADRNVLKGAWPARLHDALAAMPEIRRVAAFGDPVGAKFTDATGSVDQEYEPVEIYEVPRTETVASVAEQEPLRVGGGPEALIALADLGLLDGGRPVLLNDGDPDVATDTLRRREVSFSNLRGGSSPTLEADQEYTGDAAVKDFTEDGWEAYRSVAELSGIKGVTASSSAADITSAPDNGSLARHPFAALDGDSDTYWASSGWSGASGEWLEVEFAEARDPKRIQVAFGRGDFLGPAVTEVEVSTAAGRLVQRVRDTSAAQPLDVPAGATTRLRIKVTGTAATSEVTLGTRVAISELAVPGVTPRRAVSVPGSAGTQVFTGLNGYSPACMRGSKSWVCSPYLAAESEEGSSFHRTFTSPGGPVRLSGTTIVADGETVSGHTGAEGITASSLLVEHPAALPRSAFDGDRATVWISSMDEEEPTLTRELGAARTVSRLVFRFPAKRGVTRVTVSGDRGQTREGLINEKGVFTFAPLKTKTLTIGFPFAKAVQVSEVEIPGVPVLRLTGPVPSSCGTGPSFTLGSAEIETRLVGATRSDLLAGRPVRYESCRAVSSPAGRQTLSSTNASFLISTAALRPAPSAVPAKTVAQDGGTTITRWDAAERRVDVRPSGSGTASYLVVAENFNEGWTAALGGKRLKAVRLDGWKQAWELPAGASGTVRLLYEPDRTYRLCLLVGLVLVLLVVVLAAVPGTGPTPARPTGRGARLRWAVPLLGLWTAGPVGLAAGAAALPLARRLPGFSPPVLAGLAAWSTVLGGYLYTHGLPEPYAFFTRWLPSLLILLLGALLLTPAAEPLGGLLDEEVAERGEEQREERRDAQDEPEVPQEQGPSGEVVPQLDHR
ncbi:alpha-(1-_3)-arabinofuranosyltransferase [Actinocorallia aurantiaca]|uniref:Alpha-(1->3)-arabinofuranosyltransferase n=1 Tax=Actinocorallia aurantiaca TaxID=46204 RepID=A0ABP6H1W6_9ACTN